MCRCFYVVNWLQEITCLRSDAFIINGHVRMIVRSANKAHCSFPAPMEKSGGSGAFDLFPGALLQPLSCGEIWIIHPCLASLYTLVWTCPYAHGHTDARVHTIACRYFVCIWGTQTQTVSFFPHAYRGELRSTCSQSQIEACGTAAGEESVLLC